MRCTSQWCCTLLILLLTSCSTTNDAVSKGPFQKRKYRSGWHVDLGTSTQKEHPFQERTVRSSLERIEPRTTTRLNTREPVASLLSVERRAPLRRIIPPGAPNSDASAFDVPADMAARVASCPAGIDEQASEPRRWNRMALVSGVFLIISLLVIAAGGGSVLGYVLTFSFLTGLIGLLLCIKHKERGKGIAIAAMAFPIALLAAVIIALNSWH